MKELAYENGWIKILNQWNVLLKSVKRREHTVVHLSEIEETGCNTWDQQGKDDKWSEMKDYLWFWDLSASYTSYIKVIKGAYN